MVWEPIPTDSLDDGAVATPTTVVWEPLPSSEVQIQVAEGESTTETITAQDSSTVRVAQQETPPPEVPAIEQEQPSRVPELPPPPPLQALNRSIAFGDGLVGPDISLRLPNGFRWSQRWFGDVTVLGYSYQDGRKPGDPFVPAIDSGNLDGWAILHANLLQTENWSIALNTSFRSLQSNPNVPGGSTGITDGVSSGFRIARAIGDNGGIAFGGEQVIQWDDQTDTGRNLYLVASNGWWLGDNKKDYPLFIASGGFGTGRWASFTKNDPAGQDLDDIFDFTCITVETNRKLAKIDENLCWGPFGSASLVFNEWWGIFVEYVSSRATLGVSSNMTGGIPLRFTAGVHFVKENEIVPPNELRWIIEASLGF
ncbi:hypothetical protein [Synechococcus sp. BS56D]|uniref:hypothetical protein n=1 Tax=Synechococcus sp. BS56D TaxID=2055944 RepID=UPI001F103E61|nr:hypothetical protein [Synechococcus sp. BS56D]